MTTNEKQPKLSRKQQIMIALKAGWKDAVKKQYAQEPEKVRNANIKQNAREMFKNPQGKAAMFLGGINVNDVEKLLTEIREEVIRETNEKK
jgi:hypothetical protein